MDNVTHTLFAITLARTPLGRAGRGTTAALVLASSAPDIDIVTAAGGAGQYLTWHRGPTHGPLGVVGLGVLTAALVWTGRRFLDSRRDPPNPSDTNASFGMLVSISVVGVLMHVLMDLPTSYGTRLLSPFDWHWFASDWMPIVDIYLLIALAAGLAFGSVSPAAKRRNAAIALVLMAANYGMRAVAHHQALAQAPRVFGPLLPPRCDPDVNRRAIDYWPRAKAPTPPQAGKRCLIEVVAIPSFVSPFNWSLIAHLSNAYEVHTVELLDARLRGPSSDAEAMWRITRRFPNVWTPPAVTAASTPIGRRFLGFARLPVARSVVDPTGATMVELVDMRFAATFLPPVQSAQRNDPFTVLVRIAPDGRVLHEQLGQ